MSGAQIGVFSVHKAAMQAAGEAFAGAWPQACLHHVLDERLFEWLRKAGAVEPGMVDVLADHAAYLSRCGAEGLLFTCSAFHACIREVAAALDIPVLGPNEAMIEAALATGPRIALLATVPATLSSLADEIHGAVSAGAPVPELQLHYVPDAFDEMAAGNVEEHDRLVCEAAGKIEDADVVLLGQFTMARALPAVVSRTGVPVLAAPVAAVRRLQVLLETR